MSLLQFDVLVILLLVSIMLIGFITGATIEFIKLLRLVLPFLIVFYFGAYIARFVFKSTQFKNLIKQVEFLEGMSFFNTFIMFLSTFIAFFGSYFIIGIIINIIQKSIHTEKVTYKLGRINNYLGGFIGIARFYIIASILILPFYLLSVTTKGDFTTKVIIEHPPAFTRIGHLVNSSGPLLDVSNSLNNFIKVVDLNEIKKDYAVISDLQNSLLDLETEIATTCPTNSVSGGDYPALLSLVLNPSTCTGISNKKKAEILPYKGLIIWANDLKEQDGLDITTLDNNTLIENYISDYDTIIQNTDDLIMKEKLKKAYDATRIYQEVSGWLSEQCNIVVNTDNLLIIIQDKNLEIIINELAKEHSTNASDSLINRLDGINSFLDKKLATLEDFLEKYVNEYEPKMQELTVELPFKAKLIASTLKDFDFVSYLRRSPLLSMYVIDTIDFVEQSDLLKIGNETFYQTVIKVLLEIYIFDERETFDEQDMTRFLKRIDKAIDDCLLTEEFVIELTYALATSKYIDEEGEITYIQYVINSGKMTNGAVDVLKEYSLITKSSDERINEIRQVLDNVGGGA